MPNGIDAGDAVVSFLADTTQLETAIDRVGSQTPAKIGAATKSVEGLTEEFAVGAQGAQELGEVTNLAGEKVKASMYEARGELGLLGEEFGIRMPRHVRSFVAELPGVGEALSAAFQATAVLFLLQILVEGTKKLSEFTAEMIYGAKGVEENMTATKALNSTLLDLSKQYAELKAHVDAYGKSQYQVTAEAVKAAKEESKNLAEQLKEEEAEYVKLNAAIRNNGRERLSVSTAWDKYRAGQLTALEAMTAVTYGETQQVLKGHELAEVEEKVITTNAKLKVSNEQVKASSVDHADAAKKLGEEYKRIQEALERTLRENEKLEYEFEKLAKVSESELVPEMGNIAIHAQAVGAALRAMGNDVTDQTMAYLGAERQMEILNTAYQHNEITTRQYALAKVAELTAVKNLAAARGQDITEIDKQIDAYTRLASGLRRTNQLWDSFTADFKKKAKDTGTEAQEMGKILGQTVAQMDTAFASAIVGAMTSGQSISAALAQATKAILSQLATQALAKSMYYLAEGIAAAATGNPAAAGFFAASGEFAAVAGLAGVGAAVMGGGGSGSGGGGGSVSPITNSGGAISPIASGSVAGGANIRKFANGGLISGATLAMMGEGGPASAGNRPQEAAIPLDNPEAVAKIKEALGGGGGDTHHWHVRGLVSPDTLSKVADQLSGGVKKRTINLHSTNTFRVQKRST